MIIPLIGAGALLLILKGGSKVAFLDMRESHEGINRRTRRPWTNVKGITLHQTACVMGEKPDRWKNTGAHFGVTRSGKVLFLNDPTWKVIHGNGFNNYDVGIEIDGTYEGIAGDYKTLWQSKDNKKPSVPMLPTAAQIAAVKEIFAYVVNAVKDGGGKLLYLHAHRQSSDTRRSDPGSAIWKSIAIPLMKKYGLSDGGLGFKTGDGTPIPEAWDPRYKGVPY